MVDTSKIKITIGKLLKISFSTNEGLSKEITMQGKNFSIDVDERGQATLNGNAGIVAFSGDPALKSLGAQFKSLSVSCRNGPDGLVYYTATASFYGIASISFSDSFDLFDLIKSCSGLLCHAARLLDPRHRDDVIMKAVEGAQ